MSLLYRIPVKDTIRAAVKTGIFRAVFFPTGGLPVIPSRRIFPSFLQTAK
ncbi:MAG: hypothetical protein LBD07_00610 [Spirochaetaceae bacterium]|nr:hypothetical protein [Spirochaetaceae bacterium]